MDRLPALVDLRISQIILICHIYICNPLQSLLRRRLGREAPDKDIILFSCPRLCTVTRQLVDGTGAIGALSPFSLFRRLFFATQRAVYGPLREGAFAFDTVHGRLLSEIRKRLRIWLTVAVYHDIINRQTVPSVVVGSFVSARVLPHPGGFYLNKYKNI